MFYCCFLFRLQQLQHKKERGEEGHIAEINPTGSEDTPPCKKLRSTDTLSQACSSKRRNEHVLPYIRIFCKKERKSKRQKADGKKNDERLSVCEEKQSVRLEEAAMRKGDEELLSIIKDKDLVAIELRYHLSCLKSYTNDACVSRRSFASTGKTKWQHSNSYNVFMKNIIVNKLVKKRRVLRMTHLVELFIEVAKDVDKCVFPMKTCQLKHHSRKTSQN